MSDSAKSPDEKRKMAVGCLAMVILVVGGFCAFVYIRSNASESTPVARAQPAKPSDPSVSLSKSEMSEAPVLTSMELINAKIKYLNEHPPQVSDGTPRVMYWGHISSAIEALPTRVKAFDYKSDGSIEGVEMIWQVQGSDDEKTNSLNSMLGAIVVCDLIILIGGYDANDDTLVSVEKELDQLIVQHGKEALNNEVSKTFGNVTVRYKVVQDNGKNTPRLRIGLCPDF